MSKQFRFKSFSLALVYRLNVKNVIFQTIQFTIITQFKQTVKCKNSSFQTIQFRICSQFSSIWHIDRTLSGASTPGQSGPRSDGNEGVLCILQSTEITEASPSDCLVSYPGHSVGESYLSAKNQSVYSIDSAQIYLVMKRKDLI